MNMLAREIAIILQAGGVGTFGTTNPDLRDIYVGEMPYQTNEGLYIIEVPSPPPHQYIDTEYTVLDFWYRSAHTDRAHDKLETVFELLHRRYDYQAGRWFVYFSQALGGIVDADRDIESGKLYRLSIQFICRNLNHLS